MCRSFAAVGVDPAVMGIGPAVAIPAAVKAAGLETSDIDLFEINEVQDFFRLVSYLLVGAPVQLRLKDITISH